MYISNQTYDVLKELAMKWLPALVTLVSALTAIWGIPYGEAIAATIGAINVFLGAGLGISSKNYSELLELEQNYTDTRRDLGDDINEEN